MSPTRLEIIDTTLSYLERGDVQRAINYLNRMRELIVRENMSKLRRPRVPLIQRCIDMVEKDRIAREKLKEIIEKYI